MTDLSAGTVILMMAACGAETDLVAFAGAVARNHGLRAINQRVAVIIGRTAALSHVIDHPTAGALSARLTAFAWT